MDGVDRLQVMTLIAKALGSSILSGNSGSGSVQIVKILKVGLPTVPPHQPLDNHSPPLCTLTPPLFVFYCGTRPDVFTSTTSLSYFLPVPRPLTSLCPQVPKLLRLGRLFKFLARFEGAANLGRIVLLLLMLCMLVHWCASRACTRAARRGPQIHLRTIVSASC